VLQADPSLKIGSVSKPEFSANKKFEKQKTEKIQIMLLCFLHEELQVFFFLGGKSFLDPELQNQLKPNPIRIRILEEQFLVIISIFVVPVLILLLWRQ
jgi:hypothetical protein